MFRPRVVIPADSPPLVGASPCLAQLDEFADVVLYRDRPADDQEKVRRVSEADILLNSRGSLRFPREVLQQLPRLKMIAVCGIGYDAIDLPTATEQGIVVSNVPGRTATVVAEHALGLMFAVARNMAFQTLELKAGRWRGDLGVSLTGRQIGVIGTGNIGCEMIRLCRAVGMKPVAWSLHPDPAKAARLGFEYVTLEQLLKTSDVISLHTRLSDQTRGLMNAERFAMMKRGSILVNTARGAMVEADSLVEALESGHLFGAGLDVYDEEPLGVNHPILQCARVVLTPHTADTTQEGLDVLTVGCIENIRAFLNGKPQNVVNPDVLEGH